MGGASVTDVQVVGGGSAGRVLAARLSEDPACEVTLLEAGPDLAGAAGLPPDVVDASEPALTHDWGYAAEPDRLGRCIALPRAKLIGGCSATNGASAALVIKWNSHGSSAATAGILPGASSVGRQNSRNRPMN